MSASGRGSGAGGVGGGAGISGSVGVEVMVDEVDACVAARCLDLISAIDCLTLLPGACGAGCFSPQGSADC